MLRLLLLTAPFLTAILLYLVLNTFERAEDRTAPSAQSTEATFEAYSEGLNTVLFDIEGNVDYTLYATRQLHFANDSSEFEDPWLRLFDPEKGDWNIVADSGTISGAGAGDGEVRLIELSGGVEGHRLDKTGNRLRLNTERLTVNPRGETLYTESPVTVRSESITQSAVGMTADLKRDEIVFNRNIQGRYESPVD